MKDDIYSQTYQLKKLIEEDSRLIELNAAEQEMNQSEEVMALSYKKDVALSHYNDMLALFSDDNPSLIQARKELQSAKMALDSHPLVARYLKAYNQVRDLYNDINQDIFSLLNVHVNQKEKAS